MQHFHTGDHQRLDHRRRNRGAGGQAPLWLFSEKTANFVNTYKQLHSLSSFQLLLPDCICFSCCCPNVSACHHAHTVQLYCKRRSGVTSHKHPTSVTHIHTHRESQYKDTYILGAMYLCPPVFACFLPHCRCHGITAVEMVHSVHTGIVWPWQIEILTIMNSIIGAAIQSSVPEPLPLLSQ